MRVDGNVAHIRPVSVQHASRVRAGVAWFEGRLAEAAGRTMRVKVEAPADDTPSEPPADPSPALDDTTARREAESNKLARAAMDLFQARLLRVEEHKPDQPKRDPD